MALFHRKGTDRATSQRPLPPGKVVGGCSALRPSSCLPLTREVANPEGLTEGEIRRAYAKGDAQSKLVANSLPQSPAATAPSSEGAKGAGCSLRDNLLRGSQALRGTKAEESEAPRQTRGWGAGEGFRKTSERGVRGAFRLWYKGPPAAFLSTFRRWKVDDFPAKQVLRGPRLIKPPRSPEKPAPCGRTAALAAGAFWAVAPAGAELFPATQALRVLPAAMAFPQSRPRAKLPAQSWISV